MRFVFAGGVRKWTQFVLNEQGVQDRLLSFMYTHELGYLLALEVHHEKRKRRKRKRLKLSHRIVTTGMC